MSVKMLPTRLRGATVFHGGCSILVVHGAISPIITATRSTRQSEGVVTVSFSRRPLSETTASRTHS